MPITTAEQLKTRRQQAKSNDQAVKRRVLVCAGTGCVANGSLKVFDALEDEAKKAGVTVSFELDKHEDAYMAASGCHGFCQMGPLVHILPDDILYTKVKVDDAAEIVEETLKSGNVVERLLYVDPKSQQPKKGRNDIPFYAGQTRIALKRCGEVDPESLDAYFASGGLEGLEKALFEMTPDRVIEEVLNSGLRGRGGGGFPTGLKWKFARQAKGDHKYVICNGDEGDPGAFMDRSLMEGDPFSVLEGMAIAAYAIDATKGYIYVRQEYPLAIKRLEKAIATLREEGLLGENILGTGFSFDVIIKMGAGAFVCGEETALIHSVEGKRGEPRPRPPFPAQSGAFGMPTIINNVETLSNLGSILSKGADWFASFGTESSKGTKVFALTGKINSTGLVEVAMGTTIRKIVEDIGGGVLNGKQLKGVQMGGPSGGCVPASHADIEIDFESLKSVGAMMGSGGMVVMDEDNCMVDVAKFFMDFIQRESCGKCVPCRIGTKRMLGILTNICEGKYKPEELDEVIAKLEDIGTVTIDASLCGLGQTAPNPVLSTLRWFRHEYEAHIRDHRCPAKACKPFLRYAIDPDKCRGCSLCAKRCPANAITGEKKKPHVIDQDKCVMCGACATNCKFEAVIITS